MIKVLNTSIERLGNIKNAISSSRREEINGENVIDFEAILDSKLNVFIDEDAVFEFENDYFDIGYFKKVANEDNTFTVNVESDHVSYRLNDEDYNLDYFTSTGTPTAILTEILAGTGFTVGTVEYTDSVTYSAQEAKSRRALLMEFVAYLGGEVEFNKFEVSIVEFRGSRVLKRLIKGKNVNVIEKIVNKREKDKNGNPLVSYKCECIYIPGGNTYSLGDDVMLIQNDLGINEELRVVSIDYNPYDEKDVTLGISNYINSLSDSLYRIETTSVTKEAVYNGCRIGPEFGFVAERSDKMARNTMNATQGYVFDIGDGTGTYVPVFYVVIDEETGEARLYIDGTICAVSIMGAVIPDILYFGLPTEVGQCRIDTRVDGFRFQAHQSGNYLAYFDNGSLEFFVNDVGIATLRADGTTDFKPDPVDTTSIVYKGDGTGFDTDLDGVTDSWTWTKDGSDRITKLESSGGRVVNITY